MTHSFQGEAREKIIPAGGDANRSCARWQARVRAVRSVAMSRTAIRTPGVLATIVVLAVLAVGLTGCGVGRASSEEKISETTVSYLRALAEGDTATACEQLTRAAKGSACEVSMKGRLSGLESGALKRAADDSMDIDVHGATAT